MKKINKSGRDKKLKFIEGRISVSASGFGFVTPVTGAPDIFIPPRYLGNALDGDIVKVSLLREEARFKSKGPAGMIEKVVYRERTTAVGELIAGRKLRPLSKKLPETIDLHGSLGDAKKGDWLEIEIHMNTETHSDGHRGKIKDIIGKVGMVEDDLNAIIREYGLLPPYSPKEEENALNLNDTHIHREDMTNLLCVTIDPPDAKDFDDAISISHGKTPNEIELGVHIADVAAWIQPGSEFDMKASERAFTSYLPGKTLPMFPKEFTKKISLSPGKKSLCNTVIITVDKNSGKILRSRRVHSTVEIAKRLTFDEVQDFINGKTHEDWTAELSISMKHLLELTRKMREYRRLDEDFLELATTEIRILCDDITKEILGLRKEIQTESDQLVEECMLAANVEVAKEFILSGLPGIFRVHPEPEEEELLEFSTFIEETFGLNTGDMSSRKACNYFLGRLRDDHKKAVIVDAFIRSLPRAYYHSEQALHYGLGKGLYLHFTSPIRRYPDVIVHQQLWAHDLKKKIRSKKEIEEISALCTEMEALNSEAYFAANDRLKLHYMKNQISETRIDCFEGIIRKLSKAGLTAFIPELGINAFVPVEYLGGKFHRKSGMLNPRKGHTSYKCGDFIYLFPDRIDLVRGSAIFKPVR